MDSFQQLVADLTACRIGTTFNFLRDEVPGLDVAGGAAVRRTNLLRYLDARSNAEIVAVGEAAGYCGARWSGIAFTSERILGSWGAPFVPSSLKPGGWAESSATTVHRVLEALNAQDRVLLWNIVPTHPHHPGKRLSNRGPTPAEIRAGAVHACRLIAMVQPQLVVAIGRDAESGLRRCRHDGVQYIRHPANGGGPDFERGMRGLLDSA